MPSDRHPSQCIGRFYLSRPTDPVAPGRGNPPGPGVVDRPVKDLLEDVWTLMWTGGCALAFAVLYMLLCAGPVAFSLIARFFTDPSRRGRPPSPGTRRAWAFKGLPLGPRW